jgi:hypothetical protein
VNEYATYIATQTLAESITVVEKVSGGIAVDFDDYVVNIAIIKA